MSITTKTQTQSLLYEVITKFENELVRMEELSNSILNKVSMLKDAHCPEPKPDGKIEERVPGFIADLENHLDKMSELNDVLRQANEGLIISVG